MNPPPEPAGLGAPPTHISDVRAALAQLEAPVIKRLVVWGAGPVLLRGALLVSVIVRA